MTATHQHSIAAAVERRHAVRSGVFGSARPWIYGPVSSTGIFTRVETEGRRKEDVIKTSKRGD